MPIVKFLVIVIICDFCDGKNSIYRRRNPSMSDCCLSWVFIHNIGLIANIITINYCNKTNIAWNKTHRSTFMNSGWVHYNYRTNLRAWVGVKTTHTTSKGVASVKVFGNHQINQIAWYSIKTNLNLIKTHSLNSLYVYSIFVEST